MFCCVEEREKEEEVAAQNGEEEEGEEVEEDLSSIIDSECDLISAYILPLTDPDPDSISIYGGTIVTATEEGVEDEKENCVVVDSVF